MSSANRILYLSIIAASIAYFYSIYTRRSGKVSLEQIILDRWTEIIDEPSKQFERFLIGINCNVDLIVSGTKLLSHLNIQPASPVDHEPIKSMNNFRETFSLFFSRGAPGERYMSNEELFSTLAGAAEKDVSPSEFAIGGNAALIAEKVATDRPKSQILLVGPIGLRLKSLLHPSISTQNTTQITNDEIHLILEFKQGDQWGDYVAQSSSRFITSHDTFSSSPAVIDLFFDSVVSYKPDLVVLSGLHLMECQGHEIRQEKLNIIERRIREISAKIPIHLELGSMADMDYGKTVLNRIVPYVNSLGLNEQEMIFVSRIGNGPFADHFPVRATSIQAYKATEIMNWLLTSFGQAKSNNYRLQRVHFHCLTYHMMATVGTSWSNGAAALAAGARLSGKQACESKKGPAKTLDPTTVELRAGPEVLLDEREELVFAPKMGVASWNRDNLRFIFTPVLVCKNPIKTVGLGDAISATGLIYSQFDQAS